MSNNNDDNNKNNNNGNSISFELQLESQEPVTLSHIFGKKLQQIEKVKCLSITGNCQIIIKDETNGLQFTSLVETKKISIYYQYKCIFTKCNGKGRFGPTKLNDYIYWTSK